MKNKFRYKAWANFELLELIAKIEQEKFPEQWMMAVRLFNHTHVVDKIFISHLQGVSHSFDATNTPETPTLEELKENVRDADKWLIQYVEQLDQDSLNEVVKFIFTDGDIGSMSKKEILDHLIIHGAYHRGNIGMLLTACGINRPSDTFTKFLHENEPERRSEA